MRPNPVLIAALCATISLSTAAVTRAVPGDVITLPNPNFEQFAPFPADGKLEDGTVITTPSDFSAVEISAMPGLPKGWGFYQWGTDKSRFYVAGEKGAGRNGGTAVRAQNIDPVAKAGLYTHVSLKPGAYRLEAWARAPKGHTAQASLYLATTYSRRFRVSDQWTRISVDVTLPTAIPKAEINIQNSSGRSNVVWFDDVSLKEIVERKYLVKPVDNRPAAQRPRTLMFSPINVNYLRETAPQWAKRGFRGFLFDQVMNSWETDIWATDGKPNTRDESDALLREVKAANKACKAVGIDSNFVKVAFNTHLPDWFDDAAWAKVTENLKQGARFARLSGCAGVALDPEYISEQYMPCWEGYTKNPHPLPELKAKVRQRWRTATREMLKEYPGMVSLTLQEGTLYYGELYQDLFNGTLQALAEAKAPGGLHLFTEGTYHITDPATVVAYRDNLQAALNEEIPASLLDYWKSHCSIAIGIWPLGYYHELRDAEGKPIFDANGAYQYTGRDSVFGGKAVGSYADKSEWYTPQVFAKQMAAVNTICPRYNWIYAHGAVYWQWTAEQEKRYTSGAHKAALNAQLPTVTNLNDYFKVIARPGLVVPGPKALKP